MFRSSILIAMLWIASGAGQQEDSAPPPSLHGATGWLNSAPLTLAELKGKVVLVEFWTFTCINWRRTLPYTREWAKKYKDQGLVVIGVHTPEFGFEYKQDNVERAIKEMNIGYPVALDNNMGIWNSFNNNYWPAIYLIDSKGRIQYQKFGEGDYAEVERQIQKWLRKTSAENVPADISIVEGEGFEAPPDWLQMNSPENFLGYSRTQGFNSPEGILQDQQVTYSFPKKLELNQWAVSGTWIMGEEFVRLTKEQGRLRYRFQARDLHLVMGPAVPGSTVKFRVLIDGKPPAAAHGLDINSDGYGVCNEPRMYQLIRQQGAITEHEFEIEFSTTGADVYDFTFG
ncbi:MAG TPA: redoxin domain-containing protein [Pseudobacter sp.]|nr:redoxin domain-containing protein [Pseudobacter sp.]